MRKIVAIAISVLNLSVGDANATNIDNAPIKVSNQHLETAKLNEIRAVTLSSHENVEICNQVISVLNEGIYQYDAQSLSLVSEHDSLVKWMPLSADGLTNGPISEVEKFKDGEVSVPTKAVDLDGDGVADHVYRVSYSMSDVKRHGILVLNHDAVNEWETITSETGKECADGIGESCRLLKSLKKKFHKDAAFKILFSMKTSLKNEIWPSSITNLFENKSYFSSPVITGAEGYSYASFVDLMKVNERYYFILYPIGSVGSEKMIIAIPQKSKAIEAVCTLSISGR